MNDFLLDVHEASSIGAVVSRMACHVPSLVPVGSMAAFYVGDDGWQFTEVISPDLDPKLFDHYKDYYEPFDIYKDLVFGRDPVPPVDRSSDYVDYKEWARSPHRSDFLMPNEMYHLAGIQVLVDGQLVADACLHREESAPDFSDDEVAVLHVVQRHVSLACRNCRLHESATDLDDGISAALRTEQHGVMVLDRMLRLLYRNAAAETLSRKYLRSVGHGVSLHGMLADLIAQRRIASRCASPVIVEPAWGGRLRMGHLDLPYTVTVTGASPAGARYIVYLDCSGASESSPGIPGIPFGLSSREHEIAALVARGMTNRDIAGRLSISENTVKTHLKHVLDKTESHTRAEAIHALFGRQAETEGNDE